MRPTEISEFFIDFDGLGNASEDGPYDIFTVDNPGGHTDVYDSPAPTNLSELLNKNLSKTVDYEDGFSAGSRIVLILLYSLTTLLAVVGNIIVIIVFTLGWRSRTDLRIFLINLAVADLIMAMFCMPFTFTFTMLGDWIFSAPMCPIVLYMQTVSVTVSVFTNMAIGIDRFWVVLYPLKSRITKSRSKFVIGAVWATSLIICSVQLWVGRANVDGSTGRTECGEDWNKTGSATMRMVYTFFILLSTYLIPLTILSLTYGFVGRKLCRRTAPGNADQTRDTQQLKSKRKVGILFIPKCLMFQ